MAEPALRGSGPEERAERLEEVAPGYLERARTAASRLAARAGRAGGLRGSLSEVEALAQVDCDVPTVSRRRSVRLAKVLVKRMVGWCLRYLGDQQSAFAEAVARLGGELVEQVEGLETGSAALRAELRQLAERLARLEAGPTAGGETRKGSVAGREAISGEPRAAGK